MATQDLLQAALTAQARAHAPYSGFKVGAALRAADGTIHAGCNVENAAFPQGQCAEATAIGVMVAAGGTAITEILVVADGPETVTPCGGCRQRLVEFADPATPVHLAGPEGVRATVSLGELLPRAFGWRQVKPESKP
ncbi:cytidine deaminase [Aliidongia dinghuensis]|uniref:Cytidine deaminase n=2 Tax=Aliidongia dinghuensis TaxID=1867774 RepID=A0A8J3E5G9_9PROT|nr:cytidine deaminase [Aliidongia dinghuensis]